MRGRRPKPTKLRLIGGNAGHRAIPAAEPTPAPAPTPVIMKPPAWLTTRAKNEWKRLAPELARWGLLSTLDLTAFAAYCDTVATLKHAREEIAKTSFVTKTKSGYPIQSPWLAIVNKAKAQLLAFAAEFGLTPVARVRLKGTAQGDLFGNQPTDGAAATDDGWDDLDTA